MLIETGRVDDGMVIATTVHPLQIVDGPLPETAHDFRVDWIATPERCFETAAPYRPSGILWDHLSDEQIGAIPVLAAHYAGNAGEAGSTS